MSALTHPIDYRPFGPPITINLTLFKYEPNPNNINEQL